MTSSTSPRQIPSQTGTTRLGLLSLSTRFLFFTGKGGVGKTPLSAATAMALAYYGQRVPLVTKDVAQ